jgi:hypothetical protein
MSTLQHNKHITNENNENNETNMSGLSSRHATPQLHTTASHNQFKERVKDINLLWNSNKSVVLSIKIEGCSIKTYMAPSDGTFILNHFHGRVSTTFLHGAGLQIYVI